jgi:hypothetical protein
MDYGVNPCARICPPFRFFGEEIFRGDDPLQISGANHERFFAFTNDGANGQPVVA